MDMMACKCDRCDREIKPEEIKYVLNIVNHINKIGEDVKPICKEDLCEDCYFEFIDFMTELNNK